MSKKSFGMDLTDGKVNNLLLRFAGPFLVAGLVTALYGIMDVLVVGRFTDTATMSGVATGTQVMHVMLAFLSGIGVGGTVLVGRCIGEKNNERSAKAVGSYIVVGIVSIIALTAIIWFFRDALLTALRTPEKAVKSARRYVMICTAGVPFNIGFQMLNSVLRGMGDSKATSVVTTVSCVVKIALNLLLTGVLSMAEAGVAIAYVVAQVVSFAIIALWILKKKFPFEFKRTDIKADRESVKDIFVYGTPIIVQEMLIWFSFSILTSLVNDIGVVASASVGIVGRAFNVAFTIPISVGSAISAMTAQNIGAGRRDRAYSALRWGISYSFIAVFAICLFCWFKPEWITAIFSKDDAVIKAAASYLRSFSCDALMGCVTFSFTSHLSGCGKSNIALLQSIAAVFLMRIPLAFLIVGQKGMELNRQLFMLGFAAPAASVLSIVIGGTYILHQYKKAKASNTLVTGV